MKADRKGAGGTIFIIAVLLSTVVVLLNPIALFSASDIIKSSSNDMKTTINLKFFANHLRDLIERRVKQSADLQSANLADSGLEKEEWKINGSYKKILNHGKRLLERKIDKTLNRSNNRLKDLKTKNCRVEDLPNLSASVSNPFASGKGQIGFKVNLEREDRDQFRASCQRSKIDTEYSPPIDSNLRIKNNRYFIGLLLSQKFIKSMKEELDKLPRTIKNETKCLPSKKTAERRAVKFGREYYKKSTKEIIESSIKKAKDNTKQELKDKTNLEEPTENLSFKVKIRNFTFDENSKAICMPECMDQEGKCTGFKTEANVYTVKPKDLTLKANITDEKYQFMTNEEERMFYKNMLLNMSPLIYNFQKNEEQLPDPSFDYKPKDPVTMEEIEFKDETGYSKNLKEPEITWNLGDGTEGEGKTINHNYGQAGTYTVTMRHKIEGKERTVKRKVEIINSPPLAEFIYQPKEPELGKEVNFKDISNDPDGDIISRTWSLEGEIFSSDKNPTQIFDERGKYTVKLTIRDKKNHINSTTKTLEVQK